MITEVHERFTGGEPIPREDDVAIRLKEIRLVDITVTVSRAMPSALRHLEANPFIVLESRLEHQGYRLSTSDEQPEDTGTGGNGSGPKSLKEILEECDPVPSILVGYRLERTIVADMLNENSRQVLKDTFRLAY